MSPYSSYNYRGEAYLKLKEYNKALDDFNNAINGYINYYLAYYNRGCLFLKLKNFDKALDDFKIAKKLAEEKSYNKIYKKRCSNLHVFIRQTEKKINFCEAKSHINKYLEMQNKTANQNAVRQAAWFCQFEFQENSILS